MTKPKSQDPPASSSLSGSPDSLSHSPEHYTEILVRTLTRTQTTGQLWNFFPITPSSSSLGWRKNVGYSCLLARRQSNDLVCWDQSVKTHFQTLPQRLHRSEKLNHAGSYQPIPSHSNLDMKWPWTLLDNILLFFAFLKNTCIYFIYFWLRWVFVAAHGLSLVAASRGYSSLWCTGFSMRWLLLLRSMGSRRTGFSSCGMQA